MTRNPNQMRVSCKTRTPFGPHTRTHRSGVQRATHGQTADSERRASVLLRVEVLQRELCDFVGRKRHVVAAVETARHLRVAFTRRVLHELSEGLRENTQRLNSYSLQAHLCKQTQL